ncbi:hypothetical protein [Jiangella alkaliphila]|uniref:Uncharacterized protein n=1 Tax=Jiangella alkaliphila TaxID=419479 RepID=A0A1H2GD88_9ACTN|nr:hypothetical protein [Jiangella alkaliphila]SDU17597.1 hypothetical protein SAMN04488563_0434 [Jiangella alkaliphila]
MISPDKAKLDEIGEAMTALAPDGWHLLVLEATGAGDMARGELFAIMNDGGPRTKIHIDPNGVIALLELREDMYTDGIGTWYNATFRLPAGGKIAAEFDYHSPPYGGIATDDPASDGEADPGVLLKDQKLYPRDEGHLPAWHPARTITSI